MAEQAPWPKMFTPPQELLEWLGKQRPLDQAGKKRVLTLRWLVFGELERTVPDPPKSIMEFVPDEPRARVPWPPDLSTGRT